jgi:hypothetical protein
MQIKNEYSVLNECHIKGDVLDGRIHKGFRAVFFARGLNKY